jgi:hypothetical protein
MSRLMRPERLQPQDDPTALLSKAALATELGVTIRGLNKIIARGDLPRPFHVGKHAYWRKRTLAAFLARLEGTRAQRRAF